VLRENLIFRTLETEELARLHRLLHSYHMTAAFSGEWEDDEPIREHDRLARKRYNDAGKMLMPWLDWRQDESLYDAYKRLRAEYDTNPAVRSRWDWLKRDLDKGIAEAQDKMRAEEEMTKRLQGAGQTFRDRWHRPRGRRRRG
jgi:hypothetical protein